MRYLVVGFALLSLTGAWAQEGFRDTFDAPKLDARWEWSTPKAGPTYSLTAQPGSLRVTLPAVTGGYNHWTGDGGGDAPLLLAAAPAGDFTLEGHVKVVSFTPNSNFHLALVVAFSRRYLLGWGPFFSPRFGTPQDHPEVWCEPTGQGHYFAVPGDGRDVFLRIDRVGHVYTLRFRRRPDAAWETAGTWSGAWPPKYVGFMGKTFGDGGPVVVDINEISVAPTANATPPAMTGTIRVDCAAQGWPLSRMLYGHFIEQLANVIDKGLWAELLTNRKFTGKANKDGVVEGWELVGKARAARDNADYYCPAQSQRLEGQQAGQVFSIRQGPIAFRGGVAHSVRLVAKASGLQAPVTVAIVQDGKSLAQASAGAFGEKWSVRELSLPALPSDTQADFVIGTVGTGRLWLGAVSLMPADNVDGVRKDVLDAFRELKPPVVRWPGGNFTSQYDWRDGVGERDRRPPRWNRAWNQWEWNDFGTDEFLRFCQNVATTPYLTVNAGEGNPPEAAAWVEYCNGAATTHWGQVRARSGHPKPYGVPIWSVGNEIYGAWQLGHVDATRYGIRAVEFARAMRAVDPSIKLIGVGVDGDGWNGWNREVCRIAGREIDWLSVHYYLGIDGGGDPILNYQTVVGAPTNLEDMLRRTYDIASEAASKPVPLAFDEWNVPIGSHPFTVREGLFACLLFNALNRLGERVVMANQALAVNCMGLIEAWPTRIVRTAEHRAFALYANHSGSLGVPAQVEASSAAFPGTASVAALDASASLSADRKTLYVAVVNRMPADAVSGKLALPGFQPRGTVEVATLNGATPEAANTPAQPDAVRVQTRQVSLAEALAYEFPAHSATILTFAAR